MKRIFVITLATAMIALGSFGVSYAHDGPGHDRGHGSDRGRAYDRHNDRDHDHRDDGSWGFGIDRSGFGFGFQQNGFSFQFGRSFERHESPWGSHYDSRWSGFDPRFDRGYDVPGWRW